MEDGTKKRKMSNKRRERYEFGDDPGFKDGDMVEIDTHYYGVSVKDAEYIEGMVIGKQDGGNSNGPSWIIDFGDNKWLSGGETEYRAMVVPVCAICKTEEDLKQDIDLEELLDTLKEEAIEEEEVIKPKRKRKKKVVEEDTDDIDYGVMDEMIAELEEEGENDFLPTKKVSKTNFRDRFRDAISKVSKGGSMKINKTDSIWHV